MALFGIALPSRFDFVSPISYQAEVAKEVKENDKSSKMSQGFPKLPVYQSKGVCVDGDEGPRYHAIAWAYNNWSSATENTRRFLVNSVAAIFDFQLIQQCSEECCADSCPKCGHWEWVTDPLPPEKKYWMGDSENIIPFGQESTEEGFNYYNHPQHKWATGPGSLITKEAIRCAASMIVATKADFWCQGPVDIDEDSAYEDSVEFDKVKLLGKHTKSMLEDLYPRWDIQDATEPVLLAGLWANTRHILMMVGETPLPKCVPLCGMMELTVKFSLGSGMKKAMTSYPAGTEDLLECIDVTKELLKSPLVLYYPNAMDLAILMRALDSVQVYPFNYHTASKFLGVEPKCEYDIYSVFGRLGSFYLAKNQANLKIPTGIWKERNVKESTDYSKEYEEICNAYYGLGKSSMDAAIILLKSKPILTKEDLMKLMEIYDEEMSDEQSDILNLHLT